MNRSKVFNAEQEKAEKEKQQKIEKQKGNIYMYVIPILNSDSNLAEKLRLERETLEEQRRLRDTSARIQVKILIQILIQISFYFALSFY